MEADADAIEQTLNQAPLDVPDVHPNVAELYRRKVERLTEALNDPEDRTEAATALRGLIDKIVLTPGAKRGEISAQLFGALETVLAWAHDREDKRRKAAGGFPWEVENALSVSVGARTYSEDPASAGVGGGAHSRQGLRDVDQRTGASVFPLLYPLSS